MIDPIKFVKGRIEAEDSFDFGWGLLDEIEKITTKKAEILVEEAFGEHCGDGPTVFLFVDEKGDLYLEFRFKLSAWEPYEPFICRYSVAELLTWTHKHGGKWPEILNNIENLIEKHKD